MLIKDCLCKWAVLFKTYKMKYITLILLFFLGNVYSQKISYDIKAEYQVFWQPDSTNIKSKIRAENFILFSSNQQSLFISSNRLALDTIIYNKDANMGDLQKLMLMDQPSSNKRIFKNFTKNNVSVYDEISSTLFKFNETITLDWKLFNDTIMVNNIVLKKATTNFRGRKYIAWYNDKIPFSDGPYKFYGLPGLIFRIYDTKEHFYYELINYKLYDKKHNLIIDYDSNSKMIAKKQFKDLAKEFRVNPIPLMESEGAVFSEETKRIIRQKFKERKKQNNNPIELKKDD